MISKRGAGIDDDPRAVDVRRLPGEVVHDAVHAQLALDDGACHLVPREDVPWPWRRVGDVVGAEVEPHRGDGGGGRRGHDEHAGERGHRARVRGAKAPAARPEPPAGPLEPIGRLVPVAKAGGRGDEDDRPAGPERRQRDGTSRRVGQHDRGDDGGERRHRHVRDEADPEAGAVEERRGRNGRISRHLCGTWRRSWGTGRRRMPGLTAGVGGDDRGGGPRGVRAPAAGPRRGRPERPAERRARRDGTGREGRHRNQPSPHPVHDGGDRLGHRHPSGRPGAGDARQQRARRRSPRPGSGRQADAERDPGRAGAGGRRDSPQHGTLVS